MPKTSPKKSVKYRILKRIEALPHNAILRSDVSKLANKSRVSYALKSLIKEKKIVRLGYGVYAKMERIKRLNTFVLKADFSEMTREVLNRLHVKWEPGIAEKKYNSGTSTQVPVRYPVKIKGNFNRKLSYKDMEFEFERVPKYQATFSSLLKQQPTIWG